MDGNGKGIQCFTCNISHYLTNGGTRCLATCPSGQVTGVDNNCLLCDVSCSTCTTSATNCITCKGGYLFSSTSPGVCVSACPVGSYMGSTACIACPSGCMTCFGGGVDNNGYGTQCLLCNNSHYLAYGSSNCLAACPNGQVAGLQFNCLLCDASCNTCSGSTYTCTACKPGYAYSGSNPGPCINSCPIGSYAGATTCTTCPIGCVSCFGGGIDGSGNGIQ